MDTERIQEAKILAPEGVLWYTQKKEREGGSMNLSKSKYKRFCRCPKYLWLDICRPKPDAQDEGLKARAEAGDQVGLLARELFEGWTDVTVKTGDRPDIQAMVEKTRACMEQGVQTICEASFLHEGLYCAVDILHREKGGWAIYEVKSSSRITDSTGKPKPGVLPKARKQYDIDVGYQKYVLEQCGVRVTGVYIITLNPAYVRGETLDRKELFRIHDMQGYLPKILEELPGNIEAARKVLAGEEPEEAIGEQCFQGERCPHWDYCSGSLPEHSVFDLYKCTNKWKYYRANKISYADLEGEPSLDSVQKLQVRFALHDCEPHIDREGIGRFLKKLRYPLYFLDFEAMECVVPEFSGCKPYSHIPFQYSLHCVREPGGEVEHREFLGVSGEDPRRPIAEALCRDIPADACVISYNMSYERSRLKELSELFPDLEKHLLAIRENIEDLLEPFQDGYYYTKAMGRSFSIKSVLPALFPDDPELNYENLKDVHRGTEAMEVFPRIKDMPPEKQEAARRSLLEYCKLDTYAMVKVWQKLCEVVGA